MIHPEVYGLQSSHLLAISKKQIVTSNAKFQKQVKSWRLKVGIRNTLLFDMTCKGVSKGVVWYHMMYGTAYIKICFLVNLSKHQLHNQNDCHRVILLCGKIYLLLFCESYI